MSSYHGNNDKHHNLAVSPASKSRTATALDLTRRVVEPKAHASAQVDRNNNSSGCNIEPDNLRNVYCSNSSQVRISSAAHIGHLPPVIPSNSTTLPSDTSTNNSAPLAVVNTFNSHKPAPILIPSPRLTEREINRVPTPLSGRGDRKGHLFPFSRSPSPRFSDTPSRSLQGKAKSSSHSSNEEFFGKFEQPRSVSPVLGVPTAWHRMTRMYTTMHGDAASYGRYPTSPLSPKPSNSQSLSPSSSQRRGNHGRQVSRNMHLNLGRFHPSNFQQGDAPMVAAGSMASGVPQLAYARVTPVSQSESPRLMREKHREFIEKARLTSKLAASPMSSKPDAPRLDPLGSPNGAVTPLALEEATDYFSTVGGGKVSPAASPGGRSPKQSSVTSDEELKPSKHRKLLSTV